MSELEYCAFCDGGYAHSGICDKCATEIEQTGKELADKDKQLAKALADADHWKSECNALQRMVHEARAEIESKNKLIEQMREALQRTMILLDAVPSYAQDYAKDEKLKQIGKMVNTDGLYALVRDALAAERGE